MTYLMMMVRGKKTADFRYSKFHLLSERVRWSPTISYFSFLDSVQVWRCFQLGVSSV